MLKGLLVGAGVFLAGLVLGGFLLAQPGVAPVGVISGNEVSVPVSFYDEITLGNVNCASRGNVVIPAISGIGSTSGDTYVATSVTLSQAAIGDIAFASWEAATSTLDVLGLGVIVHATGSAVRVQFVNLANATSSANNRGLLTVCSMGVTTSTVN